MKGKKEKGGEKGGREERRWRAGRERKEGDQEKGEETCSFAMAARTKGCRQNGLTKINVSPDMLGGCQFKILGSTELAPSEAGGGLSLASLPCLSGVVL